MAEHEKRAKRYPTDLTDAEWEIIRPFLPESPEWKKKKDAGTLKRPSFGELFAPKYRMTTLITTLIFACSYGAAFGAIQHIPRIVPSIHLRLSTEPKSGRICLPIAQVKLEGEAFVAKDYVPPLLGVPRSTTTSPSPIYDSCQRISARLRQKASRLAEKANNLSRSTDREIIAELRQQVHWLVAGLPAFEAVL